jgi:hypothetical protein
MSPSERRSESSGATTLTRAERDVIVRATTALRWVAGALALIAAAILLWPLRLTTASLPSRAAPSRADLRAGEGSASAALSVDAAVAAIPRTNIFSASRTPPVKRYTPPEQSVGSSGGGTLALPAFSATASDTAYAPLPSFNAAASSIGDSSASAQPSTHVEDPVPRFYGTVAGGASGRSALLRLDAHIPGARLYREGDRGGRYRITRIRDDAVTLDGPSGSIVLHLPRTRERAP